jgi:hypothetical protein
MRLSLTLALTAVMVLTACGSMRDSRLNPLNWFGGAREAQADEFGIPATIEARPLVDQVLSMTIEQTPYGAIVRATGLSPTQGYYDAELVAREIDEKGVLVYDFRLMPPPLRKPAGAQQTREVTVAASISNIKLEGVTQIVVQGANNARTSRR